jgi:hypothetical protein
MSESDLREIQVLWYTDRKPKEIASQSYMEVF